MPLFAQSLAGVLVISLKDGSLFTEQQNSSKSWKSYKQRNPVGYNGDLDPSFASVIVGKHSIWVSSENSFSSNDLHDFMCSKISQQYILTQCANIPQHLWYMDIKL